MFYYSMISRYERILHYLKHNNVHTVLKTRPVRNVTDIIVYKKRKTNMFVAANKEGINAGHMIAYPEHVYDSSIYYPNIKGYISLYIKRLYVKPEFRGHGVGTALLNTAVKEAGTPVCKGRIHLIAKKISDATEHPQKFYRKKGFDSQYHSHIKTIDEAIKNKSPLPKNFYWNTPMYFASQK